MESTVIVYAFVMENQNKTHGRKTKLVLFFFFFVLTSNTIDIVNDARSINHVKLKRNKNCQQSFNYDTCSTMKEIPTNLNGWMNEPNNIHYLRLLYSRLNVSLSHAHTHSAKPCVNAKLFVWFEPKQCNTHKLFGILCEDNAKLAHVFFFLFCSPAQRWRNKQNDTDNTDIKRARI